MTPEDFEQRLIAAVVCRKGHAWRFIGQMLCYDSDGVELRFQCARTHERAPHFLIQHGVRRESVESLTRRIEAHG